MLKFEIGDIVCLTTGSGPMRVANVFGTRLVECEWEGKEQRLYKHYFRPDSLIYYKEEEHKEDSLDKKSFTSASFKKGDTN